MVDARCIHVDRFQAFSIVKNETTPPNLTTLQSLFPEHHDFFLASQHPSTSPELRRLVPRPNVLPHVRSDARSSDLEVNRRQSHRYAMLARLWKHGFHPFLERPRKYLPKSYDSVLSFMRLPYQMMALLYETVPAIEDTCLGDLGYYRMAEHSGSCGNLVSYRTVDSAWTGAAKWWFSKAIERLTPTAGRLYHHLAILALLSTLLHTASPVQGALKRFGSIRRCVNFHLTAAVLYMVLPPTVSAYPVNPSSREVIPAFTDETPFDFVMYGLMALYLVAMWFVGEKAKMYSFALMLAMAVIWVATVGDRFSAGICKTVLKTWVISAFHFVAQDCTEADNPKLRIIQFLGLSALFEVLGMALQHFCTSSLLNALPLSFTFAAVVNWACNST